MEGNKIPENDETKKVKIIGTNNRYKIKKLTHLEDSNKIRTCANKWNLENKCYQTIFQLESLKQILSGSGKSETINIIVSQIELKIYGYKHQDLLKKIYNVEKLINFFETITKLVESELKCFYCKNDVHVLYENVREKDQWTLDRIDNAKGHFSDNVVISCLECNLKRRKQNSDKFLFTKQMKIIRSD